MKCFIVAGEVSGDLHGANLLKELLKLDPEFKAKYWGGDKMNAIYPSPLKHIKDLAFMGFVDVLKNLPSIYRNFKLIKKQILSFKPDILILIDYPGFNLRLCKWAKKNNIKVCYYIAPTVWAWRPKRANIIRDYVDKCLVIFPFEKKWFEDKSIDVQYVGNPTLDEIIKFKSSDVKYDYRAKHGQKIMALIPGSRQMEVKLILPKMLKVFKKYQNKYICLIPIAPNLDPNLYQTLLEEAGVKNVKLLNNKFYEILHSADLAMVGSGTATLETALFDVPQVVVYETNKLNYFIAKNLVNLKYISLVNLICDARLVEELIQKDLKVSNLTRSVDKLINLRKEDRSQFYSPLRKEVGAVGASKRAAVAIIDLFKSAHNK